MSVFPTKFLCWNLTPNMVLPGGGAFGRWFNHEHRVLMNGVWILMRESPGSSLSPSAMHKHSEKPAIYQVANRLSADTSSASALALEHPSSELWERNFCSCNLPGGPVVKNTLVMQRAEVWSLVWEDFTCSGAHVWQLLSPSSRTRESLCHNWKNKKDRTCCSKDPAYHN